jgi:hypothetical protein
MTDSQNSSMAVMAIWLQAFLEKLASCVVEQLGGA